MITIPSPSMALNDSNAAVSYQMDVTRTVDASMSMRDVVDLILAEVQHVQGGVFRNLILTAHGTPGHFSLGSGLGVNTMAPFADVRGKVAKIWFRGCLVARIAGAHTASHGDGAALAAYGINSGEGHAFVSAFARLTGCYVVAPTEMQGSAQTNYPPGQMDSYEGLVLSYDPQGNISWQRRYRSTYAHNTQTRRLRIPNRE